MHKRTDFIDIVKENSDDPQCRQLLDELYQYYKMSDIDTGGMQSEIFNALYNEKHNTLDEITEHYFVSIDTIRRSRIRFNKLAMLLAPEELKSKFNRAKSAR